jgi:eukaryotic-like serine/threonine-protein kinase
MGDLGVSLQTQGKYGEAEPVLTEAWNTSRETLGREHRNTLARMERLAAVWAMLGKYDQSAALYTDALEIRRRLSGPDAAETAGTMVALGAVLNRRQDFGHAEPLLREALAIREKSAPQTWGRFNAESLLGVSVEGQGKPREAEPLLREGAQGLLDHRSEIPAASLFYLDSGVQALVRLYQNLSEPEKALEWQRKLKTPH